MSKEAGECTTSECRSLPPASPGVSEMEEGGWKSSSLLPAWAVSGRFCVPGKQKGVLHLSREASSPFR